jgi:hypothetical protein
MEEKLSNNKVWRLAADTADGRLSSRKMSKATVVEEDFSPQVARENIVKEMMRIFDSLLGCSSKRTGVNLAFLHAAKSKPESGTQHRLEQEIYRLVKGLVELNSPNTGFAINVLFNNGTYYYNKANVPISFGVFLNSLVEYLEGHDCMNVCPNDMLKLKTLLNQG